MQWQSDSSSSSGQTPAIIAAPQTILEGSGSSVIKILSIVKRKHIVVASKSSDVNIFDSSEGKPVGSFKQHNCEVIGLVHLRADLVASLDMNGVLFVWRTGKLGPEGTLKREDLRGSLRDNLTKCDAGRLVVQTDPGQLQVLHTVHDKETGTFMINREITLESTEGKQVTHTIVFGPKLFAASSKHIDIWNFLTNEHLGSFPEDAVETLHITGKNIVTGKHGEITVRDSSKFAVLWKSNVNQFISYNNASSLQLEFLADDLLVLSTGESPMLLVSIYGWHIIGSLEAATQRNGLPLHDFSAAAKLFNGKLCLGFSQGHCVIYDISDKAKNTNTNTVPTSNPQTTHRLQNRVDDRGIHEHPIQPVPKKRRMTMNILDGKFQSLEKEINLKLEVHNMKTAQLINSEQSMRMRINELEKTIHQSGPLKSVPKNKGLLDDQIMTSEEFVQEKEKLYTSFDEVKKQIDAMEQSIHNLKEKYDLEMKTKEHEQDVKFYHVKVKLEALSKDLKNKNTDNAYIENLEKNIKEDLIVEKRRAKELQKETDDMKKKLDGLDQLKELKYEVNELKMKVNKISDVMEGLDQVNNRLNLLKKEVEQNKIADLKTVELKKKKEEEQENEMSKLKKDFTQLVDYNKKNSGICGPDEMRKMKSRIESMDEKNKTELEAMKKDLKKNRTIIGELLYEARK